MMKNLLLTLFGVLMALPVLAFEYEYQGHTLTYTVIDQDAKTVKTSRSEMDSGEAIGSGDLIIPSRVKYGDYW